MSITLGDGTIATGEPQELAIFYAMMMSLEQVLGAIVEHEMDKNALVNSILEQIKGIEIQKDDDK